MARRKSRAKKTSRLGALFWALVTCISGGAGGYLNPNLPLVGPLMQYLSGGAVSTASSGAPPEQSPTGSLINNPTAGRLGQTASGLGGQTQVPVTQRPPDRIFVATFNIQVFGESKLSKPDIVNYLVQVVRQFDIVAIQEIRAKSDEIMPRFLSAINAGGSRYSYLVGPRLGRSNSKEQYAFIFDTTRIEHDPSSVSTLQDPTDLLHREPFMARFRPRTQSPDHAFSFWLVNIHTDPDEVKEEVDVLADVMTVMQRARSDEDDVIILGDLNASETQMGRLGTLPGASWVVQGGAMTNTRKNRAYDNLVFDARATSEFTGRWGIIDLESTFGISREKALEISDHLPVWAEFQIWEGAAPNSFASRVPMFQR